MKKTRIIVRPWVPRNLPYAIASGAVEKMLANALPKLKKVLYIGWAKREKNGKRTVMYLAATGDSTREARDVFKKSEAFGENVWELY